jgi:SAM-dependent methyltransferase
MPRDDAHPLFTGSIPQLYEGYLVPLIFRPCATELALRVAQHRPERLLELAAGTGALTRQLAQVLSRETVIVASDLQQAMLDEAAGRGTERPVTWRPADAMHLPFGDGVFDVLVCQFGVMFFPDKARAFAEAWRVLRPGGVLLFSVWDTLADNEFADCVTEQLARLYPDDPPRFLARVPHGYHDVPTIARDLAAGGFEWEPQVETFTTRSRAGSPREPAVAYCQGTPLRNEIEARDPQGLARATDAAAEAIAKRFGSGRVDARIQALLVAALR